MTPARIGLVVLLSGLLLAGCANATEGSGSARSAVSTDGTAAATEAAGTPAPEPPPRPPDGGGGGDPPAVITITTPGGNAMPSDGSPGEHCVGIEFLTGGDDIPAGVTLAVQQAQITDGDQYFAVGGSGCGSNDLCAGATLDAEHLDRCWVPISERGTWTDEQDLTFVLPATVSCAGGKKAVCDDYVRRAADAGASFSTSFSSTRGESATSTAGSPPSPAT